LFLYDEQGQLVHVSKYKNGQHIWDRETIWLGNRPVGRVETKYTAGGVTSQNIYYIQTDHLNTLRWITDDAGVRIWSWESNAFGTTLPNEDVDGDGTNLTFNLRFPGQYFDKESGMHYNYFRDYEPGTGRYLKSDPIGLYGGLYTYIYVLSNSINNTDEYGLANSGSGGGIVCVMSGNCNNFNPIPYTPPPKLSCEQECEIKAIGVCKIAEDISEKPCKLKFIKGVYKLVCRATLSYTVGYFCETMITNRCIKRNCQTCEK